MPHKITKIIPGAPSVSSTPSVVNVPSVSLAHRTTGTIETIDMDFDESEQEILDFHNGLSLELARYQQELDGFDTV